MSGFKKLFVVLVLLPVLAYAGLWWDNNRDRGPLPAAKVDLHFDRAVSWLHFSQRQALESNNPILWWMIGEAAAVSGDQRLQQLYSKAKHKWDGGVWQAYFDENYRVPTRYPIEQLISLPDYNLHFLYGLSCHQDLVQMAVVKNQLEGDFCLKNHPVSPACITHQMMGLRFMQRNQCGIAKQNETLIRELQDVVVAQLTYDPRAVDVYLQRVLMLLDSGAGKRVKSTWAHRIMAAQLKDGGWGNFQPLLRLGSGLYFGFDRKFVSVESKESDLHASAQGIWLLAMLKAHPEWGQAPSSF
jgi:hypothetical protein